MRHAILVVGLSAMALAGCQASFDEDGIPTTQAVSIQGLAERSAAVESARDKLVDVIGRLPGRTADEHGVIMCDAFAMLHPILGNLYNGEPTEAFRVELRTIKRTFDHLASAGANLPVDSAVEQGLLATHRALTTLLANGYNRADGAAADVDALERTIHELDNTLPGAPQRWVASRGMREASDAIRKMSELLKQDAEAAQQAATSTQAE